MRSRGSGDPGGWGAGGGMTMHDPRGIRITIIHCFRRVDGNINGSGTGLDPGGWGARWGRGRDEVPEVDTTKY